MEAGYDFLLLRSRMQQRFVRVSAIFLLGGGAAYFVYSQKAGSDLDDLNYTVAPAEVGVPPVTNPVSSESEQAALQPSANTPDQAQNLPITPVEQPSSSEPDVVGPPDTAVTIPVPNDPPPVAGPRPQISTEAIAKQQPYLENAIDPINWVNIQGYEPLSASEIVLLQGFERFDSSLAAPVGTLSVPSKIIIPSIGVDSLVTGLKILDVGNSRAYETPKHVVGHIPELANPGEMGSAWFFGHLESPIAGEGNVFYNLPGVPNFLREGRAIYAIVESGPTAYLYQIVETQVVNQNDMTMYDTGRPTIHLVTCVPRFVYDHRLIVTGELVGIRSS
ncbi:MAG: sortase [Dehalococcoidia bacterium]|nr:sortase [Dehalococcoidia bacterium]